MSHIHSLQIQTDPNGPIFPGQREDVEWNVTFRLLPITQLIPKCRYTRVPTSHPAFPVCSRWKPCQNSIITTIHIYLYIHSKCLYIDINLLSTYHLSPWNFKDKDAGTGGAVGVSCPHNLAAGGATPPPTLVKIFPYYFTSVCLKRNLAIFKVKWPESEETIKLG